MAAIRVTTTVEIIENGHTVASYSRTIAAMGVLDNPRFYGRFTEDAALIALSDVRSAVEAVHGSAASEGSTP